MNNVERTKFECQVKFNETMIKQNRKDAAKYIEAMMRDLEYIEDKILKGESVKPDAIKQLYGRQSAIECLERIEKMEIKNNVFKMVLKED